MWRTKDDVLKDLAECTGRVPVNLDDNYLVRGSSRPPPPPQVNEDDDEEYRLRFGGCGDQLPRNSGPDLAGITNMLRMVDTFDRPEEIHSAPKSTLSSPRNNGASKSTIVITKPADTLSKTKCPSRRSMNAENIILLKSNLNPDVNEFVPKFLKAENTSEYNNGDGNNIEVNSNKINHSLTEPKTAVIKLNTKDAITTDGFIVNSKEENKVYPEEHKLATPLSNENKLNGSLDAINNEAFIAKTNGDKDSYERQKMVDLLKNKISASSKENTLQKKRDKNVALAALLRLNSGQPVTPPNTASLSSTPKCSSPLMPASKCPQFESNIKNEATPLVLFTPDYFAGPSRPPKVVNVDENEQNIPEPKPLLETPLKTPSPLLSHDPYIKDSIDKVNNWLDSPQDKPKAKTLSPHIGPITFKKKETVSPKSPSSEVSKKAEPVYAIPSFKPSQYAAELAKNMEARVKAKEEKEAKEVKKPTPLETFGLNLKWG